MGKNNKSQLFIGTIIATLIGLTPYLFYLHESVPTTKVWNTFLFSYDSGSWDDANFAIWVLTNKLIPLMLLLIWFLTSRHWWYHVLLIPITMYTYQVVGFFDNSITYIDEFQLIHLVPVMAIIIPTIYLIRARLLDRINNVDKSIQDLEDELKLKPKTFIEKIKAYF